MQTHKMSKLWREATKLPCPPFLRSRCLVQTAYDLRIPIQRYRFDVEKKRDIYMYVYTVSFRRKGSRKAVLSSNLRTLDTQNKVTLISHRKRFSFSSTSGIFCYVDIRLPLDRDAILYSPPLRSNEISHTFLFPSLKKSTRLFLSFPRFLPSPRKVWG